MPPPAAADEQPEAATAVAEPEAAAPEAPAAEPAAAVEPAAPAAEPEPAAAAEPAAPVAEPEPEPAAAAEPEAAAAPEPEAAAAPEPEAAAEPAAARRGAGRAGDARGRRGGLTPQSAARVPFVGLTGGLGSGKSTALAALGRLGAATLSTDAVVHELYLSDEVRDAVVEPVGGGGGARGRRRPLG